MFMSFMRVTAFSLALILITGVAYPYTVTALSQLLFPSHANGSLIKENGRIIGSEIIGQNFTTGRYFQGRPSAVDYMADNSGASNLAVTSKALNETYKERIAAEEAANGTKKIPVDLITASGSGLDPDISPEAASYQAERIAKLRGLDVAQVQKLIETQTKGPTLGLLGMPRVNVLAINRELDKMQP